MQTIYQDLNFANNPFSFLITGITLEEILLQISESAIGNFQLSFNHIKIVILALFDNEHVIC
jgi:hypothetical protein